MNGGVVRPRWGKPYGGLPIVTPEGPVFMFRRRQAVRFYTLAGKQVGPEQPNVAPALAYALSRRWIV